MIEFKLNGETVKSDSPEDTPLLRAPNLVVGLRNAVLALCTSRARHYVHARFL
jgi:hypothetical protein